MPTSALPEDAEYFEIIQHRIWHARLPLEIRLAASESRNFDKTEPYLVSYPRLLYLPFLLPRLLTFYSDDLIADREGVSSETGYFTFEEVPLKWHLPIGLLYDIYVLSTQDVNHDDSKSVTASSQKGPPFRLTVHFSQPTVKTKTSLINPSPAVVHDSFTNAVKEADFLRSGTAKPIMSLNATDSKALWSSTQDNDLGTWARIHSNLLPTNAPWRNIPLRIYLPSAPSLDPAADDNSAQDREQKSAQGQIRVIQSQMPPFVSTSAPAASTTSQLRVQSGQGAPQTIGTALHSLLPRLFPSRRTPILAKPLLHGAPVPMGAVLEELASKACYADGWVNVVVAISS